MLVNVDRYDCVSNSYGVDHRRGFLWQHVFCWDAQTPVLFSFSVLSRCSADRTDGSRFSKSSVQLCREILFSSPDCRRLMLVFCFVCWGTLAVLGLDLCTTLLNCFPLDSTYRALWTNLKHSCQTEATVWHTVFLVQWRKVFTDLVKIADWLNIFNLGPLICYLCQRRNRKVLW